MKINKLFYIFLVPAMLFGISKEGEEVRVLDDLIASSERQLEVCRELRALLVQFQKQQDLFHQGEQTKDLAIQMVLTASKILNLSKEHHLMHLFSPFFIEELNLFSGIAKKQNL